MDARGGPSTYLHGSSDEEQARLSLLNELLNARCVAELPTRGVRRALDVGSGLGQMTRALARALGPEARVVGVERDERQLAAARRLAEEAGEGGRVDFRAGDALDLPLAAEERGSFDLVHARFVLEHLRDPLAAVRAMVRELRPGGRIALIDDDHETMRFWPPIPALDELWHAYWRTYEDLGNDPLVGRKLVDVLFQAGAIPVRASAIAFGGCRGQPEWPGLVENLRAVLAGALEAVERGGRLPRERAEAALAELALWSRHPGATLTYALPYAEGRRAGPAAGDVARGSGLP